MINHIKSECGKLRKKRICRIVNFAVLADHRVKIEESKNRYQYLDLARELKKLWNMKVTVRPIVVVTLVGTILKRLVKGLEEMEKRG